MARRPFQQFHIYIYLCWFLFHILWELKMVLNLKSFSTLYLFFGLRDSCQMRIYWSQSSVLDLKKIWHASAPKDRVRERTELLWWQELLWLKERKCRHKLLLPCISSAWLMVFSDVPHSIADLQHLSLLSISLFHMHTHTYIHMHFTFCCLELLMTHD